MQQIEREQMAKILAKRVLPDFRSGDTIKVTLRIKEGGRERSQDFTGVCIGRNGKGLNENFTVRKISHGEGVERTIPFFSPDIQAVKVLRHGKVRRARLNYLRGLRGKAARIPERSRVERPAAHKPQTTQAMHSEADLSRKSIAPSNVSGLPYSDPASRGFYHTMVSALKGLQDLEGRAEGSSVRDVVAAAVNELPSKPLDGAHAEQLALLIGEYLCPLMFSKDEAVAAIARSGVDKIGILVAHGKPPAGSGIMQALESLELSAIITVDVDVVEKKAKLGLTAGDVFFEAIGKPRFDEARVHLQVLIEDMKEQGISALAEFDVPTNEKRIVSSDVDGDLRNKLLTIIANGVEIYSARLNKAYHGIRLC